MGFISLDKKVAYRKIGMRLIKFLLLILVLYFIFDNISTNFDKIRDFKFNPDYHFFIPALLLWLVTNLYPVWAWQKLIVMLGAKLPLLKAMRIWFIANTGRYLPGNIWVYAGLVAMAEKAGVSKRISLQGMIYSQAASNLIGLGFVIALFYKIINPVILCLVLFVGVLFIIPPFFSFIINFFLKILNKSPLENRLEFQQLAFYFFLQLVNWLLISFTFFLFLRSFTDLSIFVNPEILIMMPACWTVAFLTLIAPGGLGVREVLLIKLLTPIIGPAPAIVLPWVHRLFQTGIELLLAFTFYLLPKIKNSGAKS